MQEKIRLIDHPQILLDYQELLGLEKMGKQYVSIGKLGKDILLSELLDGFETKSDRRSSGDKTPEPHITIENKNNIYIQEHSGSGDNTAGNKNIKNNKAD